jgi:hypothetical protein
MASRRARSQTAFTPSFGLKAILTDNFGAEDCTEEELIVAIWEFLCILMIATYCAAR